MPPDTNQVVLEERPGSTREACVLTVAASSTPACSQPRTPTPIATVAWSMDDRCAVEASQWTQVLNQYASHLQLVLHPVPHFKQLFSWDCGLACALMALKAAGLHHCNYAQLRQLCPTTSIWTIDLAHLLRRFGLDVTFFTITMGPNPAFYNESFYLAHMQEDERRVTQLFHDAPSAGIALAHRSVCWQELAVHLVAGQSLVILLVDKRKLDPWLMAADMCLPYALCGMDLGYTGHYILLVGWDAHTGQFLAHDPSNCGPNEVRVTPAALDAARSAFGTDEDVLLVRHATLSHSMLLVPRREPSSTQPQQQVQSQQLSQHQQNQPLVELCPPAAPSTDVTNARPYACCPVQLSQLYARPLRPAAYDLTQVQQQQLWVHAGVSDSASGLGVVVDDRNLAPQGASTALQQQPWQMASAGHAPRVASAGLSRPEFLLQPAVEPSQACLWWSAAGATSAAAAYSHQQHWHASADVDRGGPQQPDTTESAHSCTRAQEGSSPMKIDCEATAVEVAGGKHQSKGTEPSGRAAVTSSNPQSSWANFWYWAPCWSAQSQQPQAVLQQASASSENAISTTSSGSSDSATSTCSGETRSTCDSQPEHV